LSVKSIVRLAIVAGRAAMFIGVGAVAWPQEAAAQTPPVATPPPHLRARVLVSLRHPVGPALLDGRPPCGPRPPGGGGKRC